MQKRFFMGLCTKCGRVIDSILSSFFGFLVVRFVAVPLEKSVLTNMRIIRNLIINFEKACG